MNGTVNPNSAATSVYFEYGSTTAYGQTTAAQQIAAGTTAVNVSAQIPYTFAPVNYRLVATNSAGTVDSGNQGPLYGVGLPACPGVVGTPTTPAAPQFALSTTPGKLRYHGTAATFTIRVTNGASAQTTGVGLIPSDWPDANVNGSPLAVSQPTVTGPGEITSHFISSGVGFAGPPCIRGTFDNGPGGVDLSLPANSTTTLSYRVTLAAPPWRSITPTLSAFAYVPATGNNAQTLQLGHTQFATTGPTGEQITLTAPGAKPPAEPGVPFILRNGPATIHGTTVPAAKNATVRISAEAYGGNQPAGKNTLIGTTRTNAHGRFTFHWRSVTANAYRITAAIPHPGDGLLPDRGCDLTLSVG
jgi:hypothetical protein